MRFGFEKLEKKDDVNGKHPISLGEIAIELEKELRIVRGRLRIFFGKQTIWLGTIEIH